MGMEVVISLPLILFSIILGFGCYFLGKAKGRKEAFANVQVFGVPTPPPGSGEGFLHHLHPTKSQTTQPMFN
ncbi:hypothetical protein AAG906_039332 [Vitis piasezkii]|uniref:Transmembrane protein n=1 Tax=Vitis vinifera TaxID=29760 RepID=A0A438DEY5_VITVI|nr:hypothetical protein CK203_091984 [Vitis vinifera]